MYCSKCGNYMDEKSVYCSKCGNKAVSDESEKDSQNVHMVRMSTGTNGLSGSNAVSREMKSTIIYGLICATAGIILILILTGKCFVLGDEYGFVKKEYSVLDMSSVNKAISDSVSGYNKDYREWHDVSPNYNAISTFGVAVMYMMVFCIYIIELVVTIRIAHALFTKDERKILSASKIFSVFTIVCMVMIHIWGKMASGYLEKVSLSFGQVEIDIAGMPVVVGILALILILVLAKLYDQSVYGIMRAENAKREEGKWRCSECNTLNPLYVGTCKCGNGKQWRCSKCDTLNPLYVGICKCGNSKS